MNENQNVSEEKIEQRAFELWKQHGSVEGHQAEFWAQAERELTCAERVRLTSPPPFYARSGSGSDCRY